MFCNHFEKSIGLEKKYCQNADKGGYISVM